MKSVMIFHKQWCGLLLLIIIFVAAIHAGAITKGHSVASTSLRVHQTAALLKRSVTCRSDFNQDMLLCLERAKGLGVKAVVLTVIADQPAEDASSISLDPQRSLDENHLQRFLRQAHMGGLAVIVKPLVQVADRMLARDTIRPKDPAAWFTAYQTMLTKLMRWASGADGLVIGTELTALQANERWRAIVAGLRASQPDLFLSYNLNWDGLASLPWLRDLDAIGISAYFPLCNATPRPDASQLIACWQRPKQQLESYARHYGKPLWFSEIGLTAREGSNRQPWAIPAAAWCPECQASWFRAAIAVWDREPQFLGLTWWSLTAAPCIGRLKNNAFSYFEYETVDVLLAYNGRQLQADRKPGC